MTTTKLAHMDVLTTNAFQCTCNRQVQHLIKALYVDFKAIHRDLASQLLDCCKEDCVIGAHRVPGDRVTCLSNLGRGMNTWLIKRDRYFFI